MSSQIDLSFAISAGMSMERLQDLLQSLHDQQTNIHFEVRVGATRQWSNQERRSLDKAGLPLYIEQAEGATVSELRNLMYRHALGRWVYFLDEDCILPDSEFIARVERFFKHPRPLAFGGGYLSGPNDGIFQNAYNQLTNSWLHLHMAGASALPVAGNFGLPKVFYDTTNFPFDSQSSFGAEEISLKKNLEKLGIEFQFDESLSVRHTSRKDWRCFYQRAWLHGHQDSQKQAWPRRIRHFARGVLVAPCWRTSLAMVSYLAVVFISRALCRLQLRKI